MKANPATKSKSCDEAAVSSTLDSASLPSYKRHTRTEPDVITVLPESVQIVRNPWTGGASLYGDHGVRVPYTLGPGYEPVTIMGFVPQGDETTFERKLRENEGINLPPEVKLVPITKIVEIFNKGSMQLAVAEALKCGDWKKVSPESQELLLIMQALSPEERLALGYWPDNTIMPPQPPFGEFLATWAAEPVSRPPIQKRKDPEFESVGDAVNYWQCLMMGKTTTYVREHVGDPPKHGMTEAARNELRRQLLDESPDVSDFCKHPLPWTRAHQEAYAGCLEALDLSDEEIRRREEHGWHFPLPLGMN